MNTYKNKSVYVFVAVSLFFSFFLFVSVSAEVFKQWTDVEISHPIRVDGKVVSNINANITVKNPSGDVIVSFAPMTYNTVSEEHNYTVSSGLNSENGVYPYCITATNTTIGETICFTYTVTPSGQTGMLGIYFILMILSYGVMGFGIWKADIPITALGSFALFFLGLYTLFNGIDVFKNEYTNGFSIVTLGVAMYISARATHALITE